MFLLAWIQVAAGSTDMLSPEDIKMEPGSPRVTGVFEGARTANPALSFLVKSEADLSTKEFYDTLREAASEDQTEEQRERKCKELAERGVLGENSAEIRGRRIVSRDAGIESAVRTLNPVIMKHVISNLGGIEMFVFLRTHHTGGTYIACSTLLPRHLAGLFTTRTSRTTGLRCSTW